MKTLIKILLVIVVFFFLEYYKVINTNIFDQKKVIEMYEKVCVKFDNLLKEWFMNKIKTVHEEYYHNNKNSISIVVVYDEAIGINSINETYILYFNNGIYSVFETIDDCVAFVVYDEKKIKYGYINEDDFDELYDDGFDDNFSNHVEWIDGRELDK